MIEDLTFERADLPRELEIQILSFMRMVWEDGCQGGERLRTRLREDDRPTDHILADASFDVGMLSDHPTSRRTT